MNSLVALTLVTLASAPISVTGAGAFVMSATAEEAAVQHQSAPLVELAVPAANAPFTVEVQTGRLSPAMALVLKSETGQIVGSVSHFGLGVDAPEVLSQLVVLDHNLIRDGVVRLTAWIETETGDRAATDQEFIGLRLAQ